MTGYSHENNIANLQLGTFRLRLRYRRHETPRQCPDGHQSPATGYQPENALDGHYRTILFAGNRNKVFIESCQHKFVVIRGYPTHSTMDVIKSTGLKKKKKVTKQRAQEIRRRRSSIIQTAADMEVTHLDQLVVSELVAVAGDTRLLRVDEEDNEERRA